MKSRFLPSLVILVASFGSVACGQALTWKSPVSLSEYSADAYLDTNMVTVNRRRFAAPEGWTFNRRRKEDGERIKLWIHSTSNQVLGVYGWEYVKVPISGSMAAERYALLTMNDFEDKTVQRAEVDSTEAYIYEGVKAGTRVKRLSAVLFDSTPEGTSLSDINFFAEPMDFDRYQPTFYAILESFKIMPGSLSERKIKGSYSFKCDDGTLFWEDDLAIRGMKKSFAVMGALQNGFGVIEVGQVETTRFADLLKMKLFDPTEIQMTFSIGGVAHAARAVHREDEKKKLASTAFLFEHAGKSYLVKVSRLWDTYPGPVAAAMQEDPDIAMWLQHRLYFYN